jgi:hypothetical protein
MLSDGKQKQFNIFQIFNDFSINVIIINKLKNFSTIHFSIKLWYILLEQYCSNPCLFVDMILVIHANQVYIRQLIKYQHHTTTITIVQTARVHI